MNFSYNLAQLYRRFIREDAKADTTGMVLGSRGLRDASKTVENLAYDLAPGVNCELVSEMIVIAAKLEQLASGKRQ